MNEDGRDLGDSNRWLEGLRAAYARSLSEGATWWRQAHAAVDDGESSAAALAEAAVLALQTMADGDPTSLGMSACEALRIHGGAAQIEPLQALRPSLPARSGLRDWRVDAGQALEVMRTRAAGECTCKTEAAGGAAVYGEQWEVESEEVDRERYCVDMEVRCTRCGSRWSVVREDGYHYPMFRWSTRAG